MSSKIRGDVKRQTITGKVTEISVATHESEINYLRIELNGGSTQVQCEGEVDFTGVALGHEVEAIVTDPLNVSRGHWNAKLESVVNLSAEVEIEIPPGAVELVQVGPEPDEVVETETPNETEATDETETLPEEVTPVDAETPEGESGDEPEDEPVTLENTQPGDVLRKGKAGTLNWELVAAGDEKCTVRVLNKTATESTDLVVSATWHTANAFIRGFEIGRLQTFARVAEASGYTETH